MKLNQIRKKIKEITKFLNDRGRIERLREEGISADGIDAGLEEENRPKIAELKVLKEKETLLSKSKSENFSLVATIISVVALIVSIVVAIFK